MHKIDIHVAGKGQKVDNRVLKKFLETMKVGNIKL